MKARDHGGNLDAAKARFGGGNWIDLSTGINRRPYPVTDLPADAWTCLPTQSALSELCRAAALAYAAPQEAMLPLAGAQAAIQLYPRLRRPGHAKVLGPTYNEHAGSLIAQGWSVDVVTTLDALKGADLAVVVNPNNPDGQVWQPDALQDLSQNVGYLVVDESFGDPQPELSLASVANNRIVVLRSFGKFYGLAGVRLGFMIASPDIVDRMRALSGPWSVSGPAIELGTRALQDREWAQQTILRLNSDAAHLDALAAEKGWKLVGGTPLFRTYETPDANAAQAGLARHAIWSRVFPYSDTWLRLGLPDGDEEWARVAKALGEEA